MQTILSVVRVRFLRRAAGSSVSLLTSHDVLPEPFPEPQECYASLLACVWECERRASQADHQELYFGRSPTTMSTDDSDVFTGTEEDDDEEDDGA